MSGFDSHSGSTGGLWYACIESTDCYGVYGGQTYWFMAAGPKNNWEQKLAQAKSGADKNFATLTKSLDYCLNTDKISMEATITV